MAASHLYDPAARDARYGAPQNVAQYLVDLHDARACFSFCGGMMFQLVLSDDLRRHLHSVANPGAESCGEQPVVFDAAKARLSSIP